MKYSEVLRQRYNGLVAEKAARDRGEDPRSFLRTGFRDFDKGAGLERGVLTVIGAHTGEGKSIFAKHLQERAAQDGMSALLLSFEDPPERTADRTFSTLTRINNSRLMAGEYTDKELLQVALALDDAEEWADRIDYHYGLRTVEECLKLIRESDADLVQLDYAQAFPDGEKGLEGTIRQLAWDLAVDAQERKRAVVVYSQLKPEVEARGIARVENSRRFDKGDKPEPDINGFRPVANADIAWASALGQRAKGLGFLFRPGRWKKKYTSGAKDDRMELIFPKKNFGSEGTVVVEFDGKTASLRDLPEKK
jgi:replicative DNA helicase